MAGGVIENGPHPVDRHVGRRVAERRISLGFNQTDLGRALGLTFQQVQKYEKGSNRISSSKLWHISKFLGVDISYFFEGLTHAELSDAQDTKMSGDAIPVTRQTVQISEIAPRLSSHNQRLTLDLMRALIATETSKV